MANYAAPGVEVLISASSDLSAIASGSAHVAFASNFFEHLTRPDILATLREIKRILAPSGKIMILQPNVRFCYRDYWMFFDHITPLDDRSLVEALEMSGFTAETVIARFLPFSTKSALPKSLLLLRIYLAVPILWRFFGRAGIRRGPTESMSELKLSIVIPAHNEEHGIIGTVASLIEALDADGIPHEILVVDDHSTDETAAVVKRLSEKYPTLRVVNNERPNGFGQAIHTGLDAFTGDAVCLVMADGSDDPRDVVRYYRKLLEGHECVFGSRFTAESKVVNYPRHKLLINRIANLFIRLLFGLQYNDITNAFKCYRRTVIDGVRPALVVPLQSHRRTAAQGHRARIQLRGRADSLVWTRSRSVEASHSGDGQPISVHRSLRVARESCCRAAITSGPVLLKSRRRGMPRIGGGRVGRGRLL